MTRPAAKPNHGIVLAPRLRFVAFARSGGSITVKAVGKARVHGVFIVIYIGIRDRNAVGIPVMMKIYHNWLYVTKTQLMSNEQLDALAYLFKAVEKYLEAL